MPSIEGALTSNPPPLPRPKKSKLRLSEVLSLNLRFLVSRTCCSEQKVLYLIIKVIIVRCCSGTAGERTRDGP